MHTPLHSQASVRAFAKAMNARKGPLNILVNNAGIGFMKSATTEDGVGVLTQVRCVLGSLQWVFLGSLQWVLSSNEASIPLGCMCWEMHSNASTRVAGLRHWVVCRSASRMGPAACLLSTRQPTMPPGRPHTLPPFRFTPHCSTLCAAPLKPHPSAHPLAGEPPGPLHAHPPA